MKHLFLIFAMCGLYSVASFGAQTNTECVMMKEANERNNPKANLASLKPKPRTRSSSIAQ